MESLVKYILAWLLMCGVCFGQYNVSTALYNTVGGYSYATNITYTLSGGYYYGSFAAGSAPPTEGWSDPMTYAARFDFYATNSTIELGETNYGSVAINGYWTNLAATLYTPIVEQTGTNQYGRIDYARRLFYFDSTHKSALYVSNFCDQIPNKTNLTVTFWQKTRPDGFVFTFGYSGGDWNHPISFQTAGDTAYFRINYAALGEGPTRSTPSGVFASWLHFALIWDGVVATIYTNGIFAVDKAMAGQVSLDGRPMTIGDGYTLGANGNVGVLDGFGYSTQVWSAVQVTNHYI
jgi:hypothetical protein